MVVMSLKFLKVKAVGENQAGKATQISDFCVWVYLLSCFSCVRLCETMDCSPPDSSVNRVLRAGILEWVAISFSSTVLRMIENIVLKNALRFSSF